MRKKNKRFTLFASAAVALLVLFLFVGVARSDSGFQVIRIRTDGSVEPQTAPIHRNGDIYTLIEDFYGPVVIEKDNIVFDGAGYTLQGPYNGTRSDTWVVGEGPDQQINEDPVPWIIGVDVAMTSHNLTIKNLKVMNFSIGMFIWTPNNTLTNNIVAQNIVGIMLSESKNMIEGNYIRGNEYGVFLGENQPGCGTEDIIVVNNSFMNNLVQFGGCVCEEACNSTRTGIVGNYWSDFVGADADGDGFLDTAYVIDDKHQDPQPLANPMEVSFGSFELSLWIVLPLVAVAALLGFLIYKRKVH